MGCRKGWNFEKRRLNHLSVLPSRRKEYGRKPTPEIQCCLSGTPYFPPFLLCWHLAVRGQNVQVEFWGYVSGGSCIFLAITSLIRNNFFVANIKIIKWLYIENFDIKMIFSDSQCLKHSYYIPVQSKSPRHPSTNNHAFALDALRSFKRNSCGRHEMGWSSSS